MKSKQEKQLEAKERQEEYSELTPKQKYLKLDLKLGELVGAKKQRRKLELQILSGQIPDNVGSGRTPKKEKEPVSEQIASKRAKRKEKFLNSKK